MFENIDTAINTLSAKITDKLSADDLLKISQAMLNLAHTKARLGDYEAGTK